MKKRMLLAGLASGVAGFLLGWVILGMALTSYYEINMFQLAGEIRPAAEVNLVGLFMANLIFGILFGWASSRIGVTSFFKGFITGALIGFLAYASMDLFLHPMVSMFSTSSIMIGDLLANTLWAAAMGAFAALVLVRSSDRYKGNVAFYH